MTQFTTDIVQNLVKKEDISEIFRMHLGTELKAFLDYEKYDRIVSIPAINGMVSALGHSIRRAGM